MDRFNHIHLAKTGALLVFLLLGLAPQVSADEALAAGIDCSNVEINYIDNPEWTHRERLEAMNRAFFESVDRFEFCNLSNQSSSSSAASSASAGGSNQESGTGNEAGLDSAASPLMTGTEKESTLPPTDYPESPENSSVTENINNESAKIKGGGSINGVEPEDIPPANNDDAIAAQIRLAAEIEKDPIKKEKLWNEYRKYKGLPIKNNE